MTINPTSTMKIKSLLLLSIILLYFSKKHDYYLSTTSIKWIPKKQQLQLTSRFFLEDVEDLMREKTGKAVTFLPDSNSVEIDAFVHQFYLDNLVITLENSTQEIQYLGREYKDDLLVVYAEIILPANTFKTIGVDARFFIDFLTGQQNIVHLIAPNEKKSFLLTNKNTSFDFTL